MSTQTSAISEITLGRQATQVRIGTSLVEFTLTDNGLLLLKTDCPVEVLSTANGNMAEAKKALEIGDLTETGIHLGRSPTTGKLYEAFPQVVDICDYNKAQERLEQLNAQYGGGLRLQSPEEQVHQWQNRDRGELAKGYGDLVRRFKKGVSAAGRAWSAAHTETTATCQLLQEDGRHSDIQKCNHAALWPVRDKCGPG
jgi:hypothetical protein